jgi:hypothetical protein
MVGVALVAMLNAGGVTSETVNKHPSPTCMSLPDAVRSLVLPSFRHTWDDVTSLHL